MKYCIAILFLLIYPSFSSKAQTASIRFPDNLSIASYRALSVVTDSIIWVAGNNGTVCRSVNGSKSFECKVVPGFDSSDFRSLYAFDDRIALIACTGSPARILRTTDGGANWVTVYENNHPDAFLDGMDFKNHVSGVCYGDPINGRLLILITSDGGLTWKENEPSLCPGVIPGEASFAASGTNIKYMEDGKIIIATGGIASRLWISDDDGLHWEFQELPILQGKSSQGVFSFDFLNNKNGIIVGGDYKDETAVIKHIYYTNNGGKSWKQPGIPTKGYRECVQFITKNMIVACGPTGVEISYDKGKSWNMISERKGFHVVKKAKTGSRVFIAGAEGRFGEIVYK